MQSISRILLVVAAVVVSAPSLVRGQVQCGVTQCTTGQNCMYNPAGTNGVFFSCSSNACGATAVCPLLSPICNTVTNTCGIPGGMTGTNSGGSGGLLPGFATGGIGWPCTATTDCTTDFTCTSGFCLPGANAPCPSTCSTGTTCSYGFCIPGPNAPCASTCASGTTCLFGQCVTAPSCSPACNTGFLCTPMNTCLPTLSAPCSPACATGYSCMAGMCILVPSCSPACTSSQICGPNPSSFSGSVSPFSASGSAAVTFTCLSLPGSGNTGVCSPACSGGQVCALGVCITAPPFAIGTGAGQITQAQLDALVGASLNVGNLPNPTSAALSGTLSLTGNFFSQITSAATYSSMTFAPSSSVAASGAGAQAALQIGAFAVTAGTFTAQLPTVGVIVQAGGSFSCPAGSVAFNCTVSYSFPSSSTAGSTPPAVTFGQLTINGQIVVSGSGSFQFPLNPAMITLGAGAGAVQFSNGASVTGNAAGASIQIGSGVSGTATAHVSGSSTFTTAGNVLGSASATLQVDGAFAFGGASIQPLVSIGASGSVTINGTACQTGDIDITSGGSLNIKSDGKGVRFGVWRGCPAGAMVTYYASTTFAAGASSGTIASYSAGTSVTAFACGVRVIDSTGAVATLTLRTSPHTSSFFGTLFSSSQGTATASSTHLTYTGASANTASGAAAPMHVFIAAATLVAAVAVRRFL